MVYSQIRKYHTKRFIGTVNNSYNFFSHTWNAINFNMDVNYTNTT